MDRTDNEPLFDPTIADTVDQGLSQADGDRDSTSSIEGPNRGYLGTSHGILGLRLFNAGGILNPLRYGLGIVPFSSLGGQFSSFAKVYERQHPTTLAIEGGSFGDLPIELKDSRGIAKGSQRVERGEQLQELLASPNRLQKQVVTYLLQHGIAPSEDSGLDQSMRGIRFGDSTVFFAPDLLKIMASLWIRNLVKVMNQEPVKANALPLDGAEEQSMLPSGSFGAVGNEEKADRQERFSGEIFCEKMLTKAMPTLQQVMSWASGVLPQGAERALVARSGDTKSTSPFFKGVSEEVPGKLENMSPTSTPSDSEAEEEASEGRVSPDELPMDLFARFRDFTIQNAISELREKWDKTIERAHELQGQGVELKGINGTHLDNIIKGQYPLAYTSLLNDLAGCPDHHFPALWNNYFSDVIEAELLLHMQEAMIHMVFATITESTELKDARQTALVVAKAKHVLNRLKVEHDLEQYISSIGGKFPRATYLNCSRLTACSTKEEATKTLNLILRMDEQELELADLRSLRNSLHTQLTTVCPQEGAEFDDSDVHSQVFAAYEKFMSSISSEEEYTEAPFVKNFQLTQLIIQGYPLACRLLFESALDFDDNADVKDSFGVCLSKEGALVIDEIAKLEINILKAEIRKMKEIIEDDGRASVSSVDLIADDLIEVEAFEECHKLFEAGVWDVIREERHVARDILYKQTGTHPREVLFLLQILDSYTKDKRFATIEEFVFENIDTNTHSFTSDALDRTEKFLQASDIKEHSVKALELLGLKTDALTSEEGRSQIWEMPSIALWVIQKLNKIVDDETISTSYALDSAEITETRSYEKIEESRQEIEAFYNAFFDSETGLLNFDAIVAELESDVESPVPDQVIDDLGDAERVKVTIDDRFEYIIYRPLYEDIENLASTEVGVMTEDESDQFLNTPYVYLVAQNYPNGATILFDGILAQGDSRSRKEMFLQCFKADGEDGHLLPVMDLFISAEEEFEASQKGYVIPKDPNASISADDKQLDVLAVDWMSELGSRIAATKSSPLWGAKYASPGPDSGSLVRGLPADTEKDILQELPLEKGNLKKKPVELIRPAPLRVTSKTGPLTTPPRGSSSQKRALEKERGFTPVSVESEEKKAPLLVSFEVPQLPVHQTPAAQPLPARESSVRVSPAVKVPKPEPVLHQTQMSKDGEGKKPSLVESLRNTKRKKEQTVASQPPVHQTPVAQPHTRTTVKKDMPLPTSMAGESLTASRIADAKRKRVERREGSSPVLVGSRLQPPGSPVKVDEKGKKTTHISTWSSFRDRFLSIQKDDSCVIKVAKVFATILAVAFFPVTFVARFACYLYDRCTAKDITKASKGTKGLPKQVQHASHSAVKA